MRRDSFLSITITFIPLFWGLLFFDSLHAGEVEVHRRGKLWDSMWYSGVVSRVLVREALENPDNTSYFGPSMQWPGGIVANNAFSQIANYTRGAGVWIGCANVTDIQSRSYNRFVVQCGPREPDFTTIFPITNERIENFNEVDPNLKAEELIITRWTSAMGITVTRRSMAWSYPRHDDYILLEYTFKNTGDMNGDGVTDRVQSLQDVYFSFVYIFGPTSQGSFHFTNWHWAEDDLWNFDPFRALVYAFDSEQDRNPVNDGDMTQEGVLLSYGYAGAALIYTDPTTDGKPQPAMTTAYHVQVLPDVRQVGHEAVYTAMTEPNPDMPDPNDLINNTIFTPAFVQTVGPYDLAFGDSVRVVIVEAVNGVSLAQALAGDRDALSSGLDSLQATIDNARFNFYGSDTDTTHPFTYEVPQPPPAPAIIDTILAPMTIVWDDSPESVSDFEGYRVYRSTYSKFGPWELKFECSKSQGNLTHQWRDEEAKIGIAYYYAVTSFSSGVNNWRDGNSLESGLTNRFSNPVFPLRQPATRSPLRITVVPNPFRIESGLSGAGEQLRISFIGLPEKATIKIYTVSGDLVTTIEHTNHEGDDDWYSLASDWQIEVASGVYYYSVQSELGTAVGKFVIIR